MKMEKMLRVKNVKVNKATNSCTLTIPKTIVNMLNLKKGDVMSVYTDGDSILFKKEKEVVNP